jgi:hypothetical protein
MARIICHKAPGKKSKFFKLCRAADLCLPETYARIATEAARQSCAPK